MLIGGDAIRAIPFSSSNYLFSNLSDHDTAEQKKHNLAMKNFQKARELWNKERVKGLDFINKGLRKQQDAKQAITDLKDDMRE